MCQTRSETPKTDFLMSQFNFILGIHCVGSLTGDIVLAKYTLDKQWYRARIKNVILTNDDEDIGAVKVEVVYIDYGNSEVIGLDR